MRVWKTPIFHLPPDQRATLPPHAAILVEYADLYLEMRKVARQAPDPMDRMRALTCATEIITRMHQAITRMHDQLFEAKRLRIDTRIRKQALRLSYANTKPSTPPSNTIPMPPAIRQAFTLPVVEDRQEKAQ